MKRFMTYRFFIFCTIIWAIGLGWFVADTWNKIDNLQTKLVIQKKKIANLEKLSTLNANAYAENMQYIVSLDDRLQAYINKLDDLSTSYIRRHGNFPRRDN